MILILLTLGLATVWAFGTAVARLMVDGIPARRRKAVLVSWVALFLLMPFPQMWVTACVKQVPVSYWGTLAGNWGFYSMYGVGWLWSEVARRRRESRLPPSHGS